MRILTLALLIIWLVGCAAPPAPTPTSLPPTVASLPDPSPTSMPSPTSVPLPTPTPTVAVRASEVILAAARQTANIDTYRIQLLLGGSGFVSGFNLGAATTELLGYDARFAGDDVSFALRGFLSVFFGADAAKGLQAVRVKGVSYARGPLPFLNAPDEVWYRLPPEQSVVATPFIQAGTFFNALAGTKSNVDQFNAGETSELDGVRCTVYRGDRSITAAIFLELGNIGFPKLSPSTTISDGTTQIWVCDDGYLRQLTMTLAGAATDPQGQPQPFSFEIDVRLSEIGGAIQIVPPNDFSDLPEPEKETPRP